MCSQEAPVGAVSTKDEHMVQRAEESLTKMLNSDKISEATVEEAECALRDLRERLMRTRAQREEIRAQNENILQTRAAAEEHHQQIDHDIIETKVREGDMQMTRDCLARDVGRARRALKELDETPRASEIANNRSADWEQLARLSTSVDLEDDEELSKMKGKLADEVTKLKMTERQLVEVADEITRVRKKRSEIQRMMKDAEQEW